MEKDEIQINCDFSFTASSRAPLTRQETHSNIPVNNATTTSSVTKPSKVKYFYEDPLPLSMRSTRLEDLWALDIHWKMLTSDRPPNLLEGGIFERLVDLGRFALAARKQEQTTIKAIMSTIIGTPAVTYLIAVGFISTRSKRGAMETKLKVCKICALEMCDSKMCKLFHYEDFTRMIMDKDELESQDQDELAFLKEVSKTGTTAGPGAAGASKAAAQKKSSEQGKKLKMQIKRTKKRKKKKKKPKENLEPVLAPDD